MNSKKKKILLVEDDPNLGSLLKDYLSLKSYSVTCCLNGEEGKNVYTEGSFDLLILDVMMPKLDGFTLAKHIRKTDKQTPIIFLTAKSMLEDRLKGLKIGGDDYITKPFSSEELLLRIGNIFKRTDKARQLIPKDEIFKLGSFVFDYKKRVLSNGKIKKQLTSKESELLKLLAQNKNEVVERSVALREIWMTESYFTARSMDVFITKLRSYLKPDTSVEIVNVHGTGFKLID
ncbi:MAG: DNA-binding response regulator [Ignavibacteriae bacterium]|nr:MAG: DNA-binding response regulator [Ignavibacteriota bacterium]